MTVEGCIHSNKCPKIKIKGDKYAIVDSESFPKHICKMLNKDIISKDEHFFLFLDKNNNDLKNLNESLWNDDNISGKFELSHNHYLHKKSSQGLIWCKNNLFASEQYQFLERPTGYILSKNLTKYL